MNKHVNITEQKRRDREAARPAKYGDTLVIRTSAVKPPNKGEAPRRVAKPGLLERIKAVTTEAEFEALGEEADTFTLASEKTRRRWRRAGANHAF